MPGYEIRIITLENTPEILLLTHSSEIRSSLLQRNMRDQRIFETGGIYFDVDIEAVKNFDELLDHEMFAGIKCKGNNQFINNALFGAQKGHLFMKECMTYMNSIDVTRCDMK